MWTRDLGDGRTEVLTVSWWESLAAIIGFAGSDIEAAVFYPEDDEYLVDRETTVSHFEVAAARLRVCQSSHKVPRVRPLIAEGTATQSESAPSAYSGLDSFSARRSSSA